MGEQAKKEARGLQMLLRERSDLALHCSTLLVNGRAQLSFVHPSRNPTLNFPQSLPHSHAEECEMRRCARREEQRERQRLTASATSVGRYIPGSNTRSRHCFDNNRTKRNSDIAASEILQGPLLRLHPALSPFRLQVFATETVSTHPLPLFSPRVDHTASEVSDASP